MTRKNKILLGVLALALIAGLATYVVIQKKKARDLEIVPLSARASYLKTETFLAAVAAPHLEEMILDAEKDGMCLIVKSGYRSKERQQIVYDKIENKAIVALPGTSEHETGLAVDLDGCPMIDGVRNDAGERLELRNDFETLPEYQWLKENAAKYGFYQSFTKENEEKTGFPAESWHWKFKYSIWQK